ncbi:MAG: polysaccharide lyase [Roseibium sp.]|uniref:heparin lyase I family protein n=1 Tax=Roseibium sp. TaxID=1936156 RepID=UPI00260E1A6E|nr:heparin lyase I family protein [Roseibium sp.]MCV0427914.1 polysaccharide lyase [Roseibium sp.]
MEKCQMLGLGELETVDRNRIQGTFITAGAVFIFTALQVSNTFAQEQTSDELVLDGKAVAIKERSISCDGKPDDFPDYINTERLVNCGSGKIVTFADYPNLERLLQFTIKPDDKKLFGGNRAELADTRISKNGEEAWYRISTLIPEDFPVNSQHRLVLAQWHELDQPGKPFHRPPLSHRLWNKEFAVELFNKQIIAKLGDEHDGQILYTAPELEPGVFHDYAYKIIWAPDDRGEIHAWHRKCDVLDPSECNSDWVEFIDYKGSTGYDNAAVQGYYFKFGLYTTTKFDTTFTAYHSAYSSGKTPADIGLMDPMFK